MQIGIDIGGTKILVAAQDSNQRLVNKLRESTPRSLSEGLALIKAMVHTVANQAPIQAIGVACGGPLDNRTGIVSPLHCPEWRAVPLAKILSDEFKCTVKIEVDTDAAALAEYHIAHITVSRLLYVTLSTGLGAGFLLDGKIYRGQHGIHPEIGHQAVASRFGEVACACGANSCLEALICGSAIHKNFNKAAEDLLPNEWHEIGQILGQGLRNTIMLYAPELIILGGSMSHAAGEKLRAPAEQIINQNCHIVPPSKLILSSLGNESSLLGALHLASK